MNNKNRIINSEQQKKSGQSGKNIEKGVATPVPSYKPKPSQPKPNPKK